jgi:hypothetical protein
MASLMVHWSQTMESKSSFLISELSTINNKRRLLFVWTVHRVISRDTEQGLFHLSYIRSDLAPSSQDSTILMLWICADWCVVPLWTSNITTCLTIRKRRIISKLPRCTLKSILIHDTSTDQTEWCTVSHRIQQPSRQTITLHVSEMRVLA